MSARRPSLLDPVFCSVETLPGIGPKIAAALKKLTGPYVLNLLFHAPSHVQERKVLSAPDTEHLNRLVTLPFEAREHHPPANKRMPYRIIGASGDETLELAFFHASRDYLHRQLPTGMPRWLSGELGQYNNRFRMLHPDYIVAQDDQAAIPRFEPRYALTQGLTTQRLHKVILAALALLPEVPEWIEPSLLQQRHWPSFNAALAALHAPDGKDASRARERLAYDELLANALALALVRQQARKRPAPPLQGTGKLQSQLRALLPYSLTGDQERALLDIATDLEQPERMMRLVQGDVGAGKTVVALLAMLQAVESGRQAAIMAPTAILAQQHFEFIAPLALKLGLKCVMMTGKDGAAAQRQARQAVAEGSAPLAVGTHALFQDGVEFRDLGLVVIDEQHRFGVEQRLRLSDKGQGTHILLMTATPIPRTLLLAEQGDLDTSILREKPPGRLPITTIAKPIDQRGAVVDALKRALEQGARAYWVCPLVEESELVDMANAEERYESLKQVFGQDVVLVHGRQTAADKDAAMTAFSSGAAKILVATTVIEVGVNVPEATIMVIEQAERFGLSQLHQLRGRIGRGSGKSTCILLYKPPLNETSQKRLQTLRESDDGFEIAEMDLKIRGAGELLGTRQSGLPKFRFGGIEEQPELVAISHKDARLLMMQDPSLRASVRGQAARVLLYLFERDEAARYLVTAA